MEETKGSILNGMHFLCAEDNDLNAEILRSMLDLKGASCVICSNGKQVVEAFEESEPDQYDAVLMDVQMPVMNGYEASRRIRTSRRPFGKTIPIIALTANAFAEDIVRSSEAGMDAHITKPIDENKLKRVYAAAACKSMRYLENIMFHVKTYEESPEKIRAFF